MDNGLPPGVLKKLAMVGLFLLAVLLLVGGEDDPGLIGQLGDGAPGDAGYGEPRQTEVVSSSPEPPPPARRGPDPSLSAWYAESETSGPAEPAPFTPAPLDDSYLINDAAPTIDTSTSVPPSGVVIDREPPPEIVE
ncbi:MAG: hypothetical protein OSA41_14830 [Erythrobacter sp.]|jgi:hypothetical protein|uniref:hypothetical protein n=1 Tax=Qipengyuania citrea TaxID=225971 RepID=UPI00209EB4AF|nr:hypothetical protein [Qipengyuania citrea]MCP2017877.1 hypothetical protein [Qipengyuania citrea]MDE0902981.1 hypothetical protein [Erythrobacter sp.]